MSEKFGLGRGWLVGAGFVLRAAELCRQGLDWGLEEGKILIVLYRLAEARHFPRRGKQAARIVGRDDGIVAL